MSEDERTLWCGNLSENVTEEMLYELFLQAGPLENVKIPRDANGRQRSYAFITYTHACSVEYAIGIFQGTSLLQRHLSLDKKTRNVPNAVPTPQINFNYPTGTGSNSNNGNTAANRYSDDPPLHQPQQNTMDECNDFQSTDTLGAFATHSQNELLAAMMAFTGGPSNVEFTPELLAQLGQQMLGADYPPFDDGNQQQSSLRTKMTHKDQTNYYHARRHKKPYSRDDRYGHKHDRNESKQQSHHRNDGNSKRKSGDHEQRNSGRSDRSGGRRRR